ncbi:hypothetical protein B0O99DRAFT_202902 [Bisporella sp. PMI_857]|nr:hypothetical protein B0O99DRAFT_202902 [Bisporella sp. PMI_857]
MGEAAQMSIAAASPVLGSIPENILLQIIEYLGQRDIYHLCLVNRSINTVADPVLYKSISFAQPKHHVAFSASLIARPRRGSLIQNVRLEYPSEELEEVLHLTDHSSRIDNFSHALAAMSNLESLILSVPEKLCHGIGILLNDPFALACLKACTLFYQCEDDGYWDLQENIHIFSHPALESLTIRRAKLDQRGFESLELPSETPLRELHLIECDINDDGLTELLLFPEALKEISMTQLEDPSPPLEETPEDLNDFILAFQSAMHSLETISIDFPTIKAKDPLKLREFEAVTSLELRDYQLFGASGLSSVAFPPNLETLTFLNDVGVDEDLTELLCYTIEKKDIFARNLKQLVVPEGKKPLPKR